MDSRAKQPSGSDLNVSKPVATTKASALNDDTTARAFSKACRAVYGFFAGLVAIVAGIRIINLNLTRQPLISGIGFILTGLGGVFAAPTLYWKTNRTWRLIGVAVLIVAALIWAFTGYLGYWNHLESFQKWVPAPMR